MEEAKFSLCEKVQRYFELKVVRRTVGTRRLVTEEVLKEHLGTCPTCRGYDQAFRVLLGAERERARQRKELVVNAKAIFPAGSSTEQASDLPHRPDRIFD